MDRSEIMEIRKIFKTYHEDGCPVNGFSGGFIDSENNVKGSFGEKSFHKLKDPVKKRIFTFASKAISNNAVTVKISSGTKDLFEKINATKAVNKELAEELCSRVAKAIEEADKANAYAVSLISYTYDVPCKTSDHKVIFDGSSDGLYTFFVCMISPVVTGKASYGYFPDKETFGMNPLLRSVENPVAGFVYPDFTDRTPDENSVLYFRTDKLDISGPLFGQNAPALPEKPDINLKSKKSSEPDTDDFFAETKETANGPAVQTVPSLDTGSMSMEETKGRDIVSERKETEKPATESGGSDKVEYKSASVRRLPGKKVKVTGDTKSLERKMINGVMCLIVPVADAEIG